MAIMVLLEDEEIALRALTGPIATMFELEPDGDDDFERGANVLRAIWRARGLDVTVARLDGAQSQIANALAGLAAPGRRGGHRAKAG